MSRPTPRSFYEAKLDKAMQSNDTKTINSTMKKLQNLNQPQRNPRVGTPIPMPVPPKRRRRPTATPIPTRRRRQPDSPMMPVTGIDPRQQQQQEPRRLTKQQQQQMRLAQRRDLRLKNIRDRMQSQGRSNKDIQRRLFNIDNRFQRRGFNKFGDPSQRAAFDLNQRRSREMFNLTQSGASQKEMMEREAQFQNEARKLQGLKPTNRQKLLNQKRLQQMRDRFNVAQRKNMLAKTRQKRLQQMRDLFNDGQTT
tara:strand:+ start:40 stop:795 length:756 start_codon:yes stop_codon:yes gene_type:complete